MVSGISDVMLNRSRSGWRLAIYRERGGGKEGRKEGGREGGREGEINNLVQILSSLLV